jgi:subtilisin family serine protease
MRTKAPNLISFITCLALVLSLVAGGFLGNRASAAKKSQGDRRADKVARHLHQRANQGSGNNEKVNVVVQLNGAMSARLTALLARNGIRHKRHFGNFNSSSVELPVNVVEELSSLDEVSFVAEDDEVVSLGHVTSTTGADDVRTQTNASGVSYTLDGTGIGIAILDSGIYSAHKSLTPRVVFSKDFTGENRVDDPYGHGTHVAAAAAGNGLMYTGKYAGVAPNANLINLRVLNSLGRSSMSTVLTALDWVYTNRTAYNIRVINMSLGAPALSSYKNDPLCLAVRKLVDAGVVVVAAAGNEGKDLFGRKQYGAIHSPGNDPSVITVGATNTYGTDNRADDAMATYSSRGPTRSFWTEASGVRHYDNLIKPDLVAPGNKLIFAESPNNKLLLGNLLLDAGLGSGVATQKMMYLSGTSVSAPLVAGAAALLLQANPKLTPNMVKMILSYTAQQLPNVNMLEQGAGQLNVEGAIKVAKLVRADLTNSTAIGTSMLTAAAPTPQSTIDGTTFSWSQGVIADQSYAKGVSLITKYQQVYDLGVLICDGTMLSNGVLVADQTMVSSGVLISDCITTSNGTTLGGGVSLLPAGVLLSDGVLMSDGTLMADGVLISDGVLVADGVLIADNSNGDPTEFMR